MDGFLQRLKERKLVQWSLAYAAGAFALLQGLDIVAQQFAWPEGARRGITIALAIGFFVALVLAWYHGERGAQRVSGTELLIIALLLAIGGGVLWRFVRAPVAPVAAQATAATPGAKAATTTAATDDKSVAVLPLANDSGDKDQQYFSDGLSDDLINALMQFGNLKVIGRTSAFQFRDSKESSAVIGSKLGVAYLVTGSVRKLGDTVRINAQLVKAADGSGVWSQRYDRPYTDLFKLQDEITAAVAGALKAKLLHEGEIAGQDDRPPSGNLAAYNAYQQGKFYGVRGNQADLLTSLKYANEAVRLDPDYAAAWLGIAAAQTNLANNFLAGAERANAQAQAQVAVDTALRLNPASPRAHIAKASLIRTRYLDVDGTLAEIQRALELGPNDPAAIGAYAANLSMLGKNENAIEQSRRALMLDPLRAASHATLASALFSLGRADEAKTAIEKAIELQANSDAPRALQSSIELMRGDVPAALAIAKAMSPGVIRDTVMALALQAGSDRAAADAALQLLIDKRADTAAFQIAETYALRRDADNTFKWLDRAWDNKDTGILRLLRDPYLLRYRDDPRFAAFAKKVGLPTTTDAKALP